METRTLLSPATSCTEAMIYAYCPVSLGSMVSTLKLIPPARLAQLWPKHAVNSLAEYQRQLLLGEIRPKLVLSTQKPNAYFVFTGEQMICEEYEYTDAAYTEISRRYHIFASYGGMIYAVPNEAYASVCFLLPAQILASCDSQ